MTETTENLPVIVSEETTLTARGVREQVQLIQQVMQTVMKDKEHYGTIPGCGNKPTLFKAGAEKLAMTFRFAPQYQEVGIPREEDDFIAYKIECRLTHIPTGNFVGSGLGTCNSREKKYRNAQPWDVQNTLYKMACKRALVAAVLNATAASDIFTQDIEDMDPQDLGKSRPTSAPLPTRSASQSDDMISDAQRKRLYAIAKNAGFEDDQIKADLKAQFGYEHSKDIKRSEYEAVCNFFQGGADAGAGG